MNGLRLRPMHIRCIRSDHDIARFYGRAIHLRRCFAPGARAAASRCRSLCDRNGTSDAENAWFRAQVEDAMIEADDPATVFVSHEDAKRSWANRKAELQALAGQGQGTER